MLKTLTAATAAATLLVSPAAAQNPTSVALVLAQLDAASSEMGLAAGARTTGRLARSGSQTVNLQGLAGASYVIGVCDENCRDLDLVVRDSAGREIGRDMATDDVPVISVSGAAGPYTVEVSMADCAGRCHWGVGVFR